MKSLVLKVALAVSMASPLAWAQPRPLEHFDFPFVLEPVSPVVNGPMDTRFFGTFCQVKPKDFCKSVPLFPDPCVTLRDGRLSLEHLTSTRGGLLRGEGTFVLDGERGRLVAAGVVMRELPMLAPGLPAARFNTLIPGVGERKVLAVLSADGLELTAQVEGRSLTLRKDACGNAAPVVDLVAPFGPDFPFGQSVMLAGRIEDEDSTFPEARQVFLSDRQGVLRGNRVAGGRTLFTSSLVPGNHRITFFVTDSGGRTGQSSLDIRILNRPPGAPEIFLPAAGATLRAGAPVLLQGTAFDPDSGQLTGGALTWSAQSVPGGPFEPLGVGTELGVNFPNPADPVVLRLTARDNTGLSASSEQVVHVAPSTGNAPPVVVIRQPDRTSSVGDVVATFFSVQPAPFVGTAFDAEDTLADLNVVWEVVAISGPGGTVLPSPPVPNPAPITGTLAPVFQFNTSANGFYRVTLKATDQGGASSTDTIDIFVSASIIL